jgi:predicted  nucleic acid-binding Zn-ribbon protein
MGPILSSLVNLQAIETELRKTQQRLKQAQQVVQRQEIQINRLQEAAHAKKEETKLTRIQHDKLELELKTREESIAKLRVALNNARTNKDYSAVLTQINTRKADKSKLEDQILALLAQIDADQAAQKEIEDNIEKERVKLAETRQISQTKQQEIQAEVDKLLDRRKEAASQVPDKERSLFERLAERYDGEVLAEISKLNGPRGDNTCGGCYMGVTLESVNALMSHDDVLTCPNCGRILILDKNPKQQSTT